VARFAILSPWDTTAGNNPAVAMWFRSATGRDLSSRADVTGTPDASIPPTPNLAVFVCTCPDADLATIVAGPFGGGLLYNDSDRPADQSPTDAGYADAVAAMAASIGVTGAYVQSVLGATVAGRTRGEIADAVAAFLRTAPKG
jgi:hypothetical protein